MDRQTIANSLANHFTLLALSLVASISLLPNPQAQVISPELRRLSAASNQFGIDTLRALDRIEPPDKVYQVVSSLRQALYVWSLQPQEINRGFRDLFEHIGLNQNVPIAAKWRTNNQAEELGQMRGYENLTEQNSKRSTYLNEAVKPTLVKTSHRQHRSLTKSLNRYGTISLPSLIKLKTLTERTLESEEPWWHSLGMKRSHEKSQPHKLASELLDGDVSLKEQRLSQNNQKESSQLSALSNIYIQRGLTMNYNYNLLLRDYYKTVIHPVDFLHNSEETRLHINSVVASGTENKIKDLVKKGALDLKLAPKIMMISTFHFRGTLDIEMKPRNKSNTNATRSRRARSHHGSSSIALPSKKLQELKGIQFIETESTPLKYGHFSSLGCSVIEVPFDNRLITLVIVMPDEKNATDLLLTRLSAQILNDLVNSLVVKRLSLAIPVIKFDRGPVNMSGLLHELGLVNLFYGNRTYSSETGLNRWLRPSDIVHETSIDIGTMNPDWTQLEDRLKLGAHDGRLMEDANYIKLDKPFFYFVMDSLSGLVLTMGRIRQ